MLEWLYRAAVLFIVTGAIVVLFAGINPIKKVKV